MPWEAGSLWAWDRPSQSRTLGSHILLCVSGQNVLSILRTIPEHKTYSYSNTIIPPLLDAFNLSWLLEKSDLRLFYFLMVLVPPAPNIKTLQNPGKLEEWSLPQRKLCRIFAIHKSPWVLSSFVSFVCSHENICTYVFICLFIHSFSGILFLNSW